jgi:hypothetical protein
MSQAAAATTQGDSQDKTEADSKKVSIDLVNAQADARWSGKCIGIWRDP